MIRTNGRSISIMILFAIALHLWWTLMIILDQSALNATGLASLYRYIQPPQILASVIGGAALLAIIAMVTENPWVVVLLLPQQILLMMGASGAIEAIWLSQFADGVLRPRAFIAADQINSVLAAIGHTVAIISHALNKLPNR